MAILNTWSDEFGRKFFPEEYKNKPNKMRIEYQITNENHSVEQAENSDQYEIEVQGSISNEEALILIEESHDEYLKNGESFEIIGIR
jgi:hypothetical protein